MNKDLYLYLALAFFVLAISAASLAVPVAAILAALGAVMNFLFYKKSA